MSCIVVIGHSRLPIIKTGLMYQVALEFRDIRLVFLCLTHA